MGESNTQVAFLIDPSYPKTSSSGVFMQTIASLLDSNLPPTVDNYDSVVSKDQLQWGYKFSHSKPFTLPGKPGKNIFPFSSVTLRKPSKDLEEDLERDLASSADFGVSSIHKNMIEMLHDFQWERLEVRSPVKKSIRGRGYPLKGSHSHGYVDSDGQQSICQSFFNDDLEQKIPTNIICIVGPIPKNIQGQMKVLQQNSKQPVKYFLTNPIIDRLTKLDFKMYWVNTSPEKPHIKDLTLVLNTLNTFHGCVLPISLFQQQFLQRCEKCRQVTTVPNQVDLQHRSLDLKIVNHAAVFPISYLIKSRQKLGRTKQQAKPLTELLRREQKCLFVCDDEILGNGTFQVLSKEPLHVSNMVNNKWIINHDFVANVPISLSTYTILEPMCHGQCLDNILESGKSYSFNIVGVVKRSSNPSMYTGPINHLVELVDSSRLMKPGSMLVVETSCLAADHEKHVGLAEFITGRCLTISWLKSKTDKYMWLRNDDINKYKRGGLKKPLDEPTQQVIKKELGLAIEKQRKHEKQTKPNKNDDTTFHHLASKFRAVLLERFYRVLSLFSRSGISLKNDLKSCVSSRNDCAVKMTAEKSEEIPDFTSIVKQFYVGQKKRKQMAKKATKRKLTSKLQTRRAANQLQPAPNDEVEVLGSWNEAVQRCIVELRTITTASEGEFEQLKLQTGAYFVCTLLHKYLVLKDKSPKENNASARNAKNFETIWQACNDRVLPAIHVETDAIMDNKVKTATLQLIVYLFLELFKMRSNLVGTPASKEDNKIFNYAARRLMINLSSFNFMPFLHEHLIHNYVDTAGKVLATVLDEFFVDLPEELKMYGNYEEDDRSSVGSTSVMGPSISSHYASTGLTSVGSYTRRDRKLKYSRAIPLYPQTREINIAEKGFAEKLDKKSDRLLQVAEDSPSEINRRTSNRNRGARKDYKLTKPKGARRNLFSTISTGPVGTTMPKSPPKYKSDDEDDAERKLRSRTVSVQDTPNSKKNMGSALQRQRHRTRKKNCMIDEELDDTVAESPTKPYLPSDSASRTKSIRLTAKHEFYTEGPASQARATQLAVRQLRIRTQEQTDRSKPWHSPRTRMFGWTTEASSSMQDSGINTTLQDMEFRSPEPLHCAFTSPTRNSTFPTRNSTSPTRNSTSPTRNSTSPTRNSTSPTRNSTSPTRNSTSPTRNSTSPTRNSTSPTQNSTSPTRNSTSPTRNSTSPTRNSTSPTRNSTSPTQNSTSPTRNSTSMDRVETVSENVESFKKHFHYDFQDSGYSPDRHDHINDAMRAIFSGDPLTDQIPDTDMGDILARVTAHTCSDRRESYRCEGSITCDDVEVEFEMEFQLEDAVTLPTSSESLPFTSPPKIDDSQDVPSSETPIVEIKERPFIPKTPYFHYKQKRVTEVLFKKPKAQYESLESSPKKREIIVNKPAPLLLNLPLQNPPPCSFMSPKKEECLRSDIEPSCKSPLSLSLDIVSKSSPFLSPRRRPVIVSKPEPMSSPLRSAPRCSFMSPKKGEVADYKSEHAMLTPSHLTNPSKWSSLSFSKPEPISPPSLSLPGCSFMSPKKRKSIDASEHAMTEPPKRPRLTGLFWTKSRNSFTNTSNENNFATSKRPFSGSLQSLVVDETIPAKRRKSFYRTVSQRDRGESSSSTNSHAGVPTFAATRKELLLPTADHIPRRLFDQDFVSEQDKKLRRFAPRPLPRLQRANTQPAAGETLNESGNFPDVPEFLLGEDDPPAVAPSLDWYDTLAINDEFEDDKLGGFDKSYDSEDDSDASCIVLLSPMKANKANRVAKVSGDSFLDDLWLSDEDNLSRGGAEEQDISIQSPEISRSLGPSPVLGTLMSFDDDAESVRIMTTNAPALADRIFR